MLQGRFKISLGNPQLTHLKNAFLRFSVGNSHVLEPIRAQSIIHAISPYFYLKGYQLCAVLRVFWLI